MELELPVFLSFMGSYVLILLPKMSYTCFAILENCLRVEKIPAFNYVSVHLLAPIKVSLPDQLRLRFTLYCYCYVRNAHDRLLSGAMNRGHG